MIYAKHFVVVLIFMLTIFMLLNNNVLALVGYFMCKVLFIYCSRCIDYCVTHKLTDTIIEQYIS